MDFKDKLKGYLLSEKQVTTKFLDQTEQIQVSNYLKNKVSFAFFGGYPEAERKRASIRHLKHEVTCFKIVYPKVYLTLTHQNILGSLLSLSITLDSIGDILPKQAVFFVTNEISAFIKESFQMIGNVPITLEIIDGKEIRSEKELEIDSFSVSSLRLDAVVAGIIHSSRNKAAFMIENDLVKVNHVVTNKGTKTIESNMIISIRKHGRFTVIDTSKQTRKGKIIVKYGKYV